MVYERECALQSKQIVIATIFMEVTIFFSAMLHFLFLTLFFLGLHQLKTRRKAFSALQAISFKV